MQKGQTSLKDTDVSLVSYYYYQHKQNNNTNTKPSVGELFKSLHMYVTAQKKKKKNSMWAQSLNFDCTEAKKHGCGKMWLIGFP